MDVGPAFPNLGVRLQVLRQLARDVPDASFTTNQLCHELVRQQTTPYGWQDVPELSDPVRGYYAHRYLERTGHTQTRPPTGTRAYTQVLLADPATQHLVGIATHFVSHAWKYTFRDMVAGLCAFEDSCAEHFYWFDCVSLDQHASQT